MAGDDATLFNSEIDNKAEEFATRSLFTFWKQVFKEWT